VRLLVVGLALVLVTGAAACGGSGSRPGQPAGSTKVTLGEYKFEPSAISVKPGKAVFYLVNSGAVSHDMTVLGPGGAQVGRSELVQPGDVAVFTIENLAAGSYSVICSQPGHEGSGMKASLTAA